jgi:hypothetical protein
MSSTEKTQIALVGSVDDMLKAMNPVGL